MHAWNDSSYEGTIIESKNVLSTFFFNDCKMISLSELTRQTTRRASEDIPKCQRPPDPILVGHIV